MGETDVAEAVAEAAAVSSILAATDHLEATLIGSGVGHSSSKPSSSAAAVAMSRGEHEVDGASYERYGAIHEARDRVVEAWGGRRPDPGADEVGDGAGDSNRDGNGDGEDARFRAVYMEAVTSAFASELDAIREGAGEVGGGGEGGGSGSRRRGHAVDVDVLVDLLQAGADELTKEQRNIILRERRWREEGPDGGGVEKKCGEDGGGPLTPHEERRRRIGF